MKCKDVKKIFDPYTLIPSYGENEIFFKKEKELILSVYYDSNDDNLDKFYELKFNNVYFFIYSSLPGVSAMNLTYETYNDLTSLVEFKNSEFCLAWEKQTNYQFKLRHFRIFFISTNNYLEVICRDLEINI